MKISKQILWSSLPMILCVAASFNEVICQTTAATWTGPRCSTIKGTALVAFTKDDGRTLTKAEEKATDHSYPNALIALNAPDTLLFSYNSSLLLSADAGCNWKSLKNNLPRAKGMLAKPDGKALVWLEGQSYAGGKQEDLLLEVSPTGELARIAPPLVSIHAMMIDKSDSKHIAAAGEGALGRDGSLKGKSRFDGVVMDSTDGGRTWTISGKYPETNGEPTQAVFSPQNINRVLLFSALSGLSFSTDGGGSWKKPAGLPENVQAAVFSPTDEKTVWAVGMDDKANSAGIYLSQDGGQSFRLALPDTEARRVETRTMAAHPLDKNILYFVGGNTTLVSYNHRTRKTTTQDCQREIAAIVFSPASPSLIYLGFTVRGIIVSWN